jgi:predicted O-methyltransferase YrrM
MLKEYLESKGIRFSYDYQGNSAQFPAEPIILDYFARQPAVKEIMEIGFNAGHSAETFLSSNPTAKLTSFDLGEVNAMEYGKEYIDSTYPGRHTLIVGDSTVTVPQYKIDNPDKKFDLIFIDGGHDYGIAKSDFIHSSALAHSETIVIVDDVVYVPGWEVDYTMGPTKAWSEATSYGEIQELSRLAYKRGFGLVWGKYLKSFDESHKSFRTVPSP